MTGWLLALLALVAAAGSTQAATVGTATNSAAARADAVKAIPYAELKDDVARRVAAIVDRPSVYRRMPTQVIDCDADLFVFLVRYPEVVVNIWQLMGLTQLDLQRTGQYAYQSNDGAGTICSVELLYGTRNLHLFVAEGYYEGKLLKRRITGRAVMLLRTGYVDAPDGRSHVANRLDVFLQLDNVGVDLLAKTVHPLLGRTADSNFAESTHFLARLSRSAERNGPGMVELSERLESVSDPVQQRFARIVDDVAQRAERTARAAGESPQPPVAIRTAAQSPASHDERRTRSVLIQR